MANQPENIVLEHLKAIRAEQAGMRGDIREPPDRIVDARKSILAIRRDQPDDAGTVADVGIRIADRPGRVGRRPGLTEDR